MIDRHGKQLGSEADTFMNHIVGAVDRMNAIIEGLLRYTRLGGSAVIQFERVSMNDVLDRAQENLAAAIADSGAQVLYNGLPVVTGDREQLVRLLQNLIGNAIKYRSQAAPLISVAAHHSEQDWIFSVSDNGIGIDPKYTEQVFELFERLHGSHTSGGRHRPGHLQTDRGASPRADLGGIPTGSRIDFQIHSPGRDSAIFHCLRLQFAIL